MSTIISRLLAIKDISPCLLSFLDEKEMGRLRHVSSEFKISDETIGYARSLSLNSLTWAQWLEETNGRPRGFSRACVFRRPISVEIDGNALSFPDQESQRSFLTVERDGEIKGRFPNAFKLRFKERFLPLDLKLLEYMPRLKVLDLSCANVLNLSCPTFDCEEFPFMPLVEEFSCQPSCTDRDLAALIPKLPNLRALTVNKRITSLHYVENLTHLNMATDSNLLGNLGSLPSFLKSLSITRNCPLITSEHFEAIVRRCPTLESLSFHERFYPDGAVSLRPLSQLSRLKNLVIEVKIANEDLLFLPSSLTHLAIWDLTRITDLSPLARLPLESLKIARAPFGSDLSFFRSLTSLRELTVYGWLKDENFDVLEELTQLESLSLQYREITNQGLRRLSCLKDLKTLQLEHCDMTPREIGEMFPRLEKLITQGRGQLDHWDIARMRTYWKAE